MTISATCPECGTRHDLDDSARGRRMLCKKCRALFTVVKSEDEQLTVLPAEFTPARPERPAGRRRVEREVRRSAEKEGGVHPLVWALGALGLAVFLLVATCAGMIYKVTRTVRQAAEEVAEEVKNRPLVEVQGGPNGRLELFPRQPTNLDEALAQLREPEPSRRQSAASWLGRQPVDDARRAEVARALEPLLDDVHAGPRVAAMRTMEKWGDRENVPAIVRLLLSDPGGFEGDECRHRATDMIVRLKDARGAAAIARNFKHPFEHEQTRRALEALGPDAEPAVLPYLKDPDWNVRVEACRALRRIGTRRSLPELEATLEGTKAMYGGYRSVAEAAQEAIDAIKARP
jgi:hypothetical protein